MTFRPMRLAALLCLALGAGSAPSQTLPGLPGGGSSLMGGMLPNVSNISAGNAAGILGYCLQGNMLGGTSASSVLGGLTKNPTVKTSPDYTAGLAGNILGGGGGSPFSLGQLPTDLKSKACNMVLKQATSLL